MVRQAPRGLEPRRPVRSVVDAAGTRRRVCPQTGQKLPTEDEIQHTVWVLRPGPPSWDNPGAPGTAGGPPLVVSTNDMRRFVARRASGSWPTNTPVRCLPRDSPVEGIYRHHVQSNPQAAWNGYDEFVVTREMTVLGGSVLVGMAIWAYVGLPWQVMDAPLKAVAFFVWFNMCPWRLLQDIRNRAYAGDGSRVLGAPINC